MSPFLGCGKNGALAKGMAPGKLKLPPGMIRRRKGGLSKRRRWFGFEEGGETFLDFPKPELLVSVQEIKPAIEPLLGLNPLGSFPVPVIFKEKELFVMADGIVISEKPLFADREDALEIQVPRKGAVEIYRAFGLSLETGGVFLEKGAEKTIRLCFGLDLLKTHLFDETVLEDSEESFDPAFGLRRIGVDDIDPEFFQGPLKLALREPPFQFFFQSWFGLGLIGGVFIKINTLGKAIAGDVTLETVHRRESALVVVETGEDSIGRIVNVTHKHKPRSSSLQPVVVGAVHLDHFSQTRLPLPPLAVNRSFLPRLPRSCLKKPPSQGLATQSDPFSLPKFLLGQGGAETLIVTLVEIEHLLSEFLGMATVGGFPPELMDKSSLPLLAHSHEKPPDLTDRQMEELGGMALFDFSFFDLVDDW